VRVFKENVSQAEFQITDFPSDLSLKTRVNNPEFMNILLSEQYPILKQLSLKVKDRSSLTDKHLNDCMRVAIAKYIPNYNKLAEEMQCQVSH
jgi:hypothetical protein